MKHLGEKKNTLGTKIFFFQTPGGPWGEKIFFPKKTLGIENFTLKSSNAVGRSRGDLGNAVGRGGKKISPPSAEDLGVKKTCWTRMHVNICSGIFKPSSSQNHYLVDMLTFVDYGLPHMICQKGAIKKADLTAFLAVWGWFWLELAQFIISKGPFWESLVNLLAPHSVIRSKISY